MVSGSWFELLKAAAGLLLVLLEVSLSKETHCDVRQDGAQCYGRLGSTVVFHLMDSSSDIHKFEWRYEGSTILRERKNMFFPHPHLKNYIFIPSNGSFIIKNLSRTDGGEYTLETFDADGRKMGQHALQLYVQAPIASVQLILECSSQLELRVSCLPMEGDSPQYSWSLEGNQLTDSELLSGDSESNIILLRKNISGRLLCSVRNNISSASKEQIISACEDTAVLRCALMFVAAILLCAGIGLYFTRKEKKYRKEFNKPHEKENPDDFEVTEHLADD
ncbi:uncharacterized protein LOC119777893 [Cyprinodon tularosa]|uniref:uncharacterized protein LOC119777893 n=1 Tax=Cyprinodon tularosa TaxID=77115 RepID=UPI0018E1E0B7|nr:uncharacterized protein LOC119777893 [Cyprinodon tularosa]